MLPGHSDSTNDPTTSSAAFAALQRAVENCAATPASCVASAAGNATAIAACDTAYDACATSAGKDAEDKLAQAAAQCAQTARECRATASDKDTCKDALKVCLGGLPHGDGGVDQDDERDEDASSDESDAQLVSCMEQGGVAKDCAAGVRECIKAADKGEHGKPQDAGASRGGQGQSGASHAKPDAGA